MNHAVKMLKTFDEKTDTEFYWKILIIADRFLLNKLKDLCELNIIELFKPHHMSNALISSCIHSCKEVFKHCVDYFFRRATSIQQCKCFKLFQAPYREDFIKRVSNYVMEISDNII